MRCTRCHAEVSCADARDYGGQVLCEDCYIEAMSPVRTCDPWAVHLARSFKDSPGGIFLTDRQQRLYELVKDRGELPFPEAARALSLTEEELRREFATLRHLELLRATKREDLVLITLF